METTEREPIAVAPGVDELEACPICGADASASRYGRYCSALCLSESADSCCGACDGKHGPCDCRLEAGDYYDPETGPYSEVGCRTHRCRV